MNRAYIPSPTICILFMHVCIIVKMKSMGFRMLQNLVHSLDKLSNLFKVYCRYCGETVATRIFLRHTNIAHTVCALHVKVCLGYLENLKRVSMRFRNHVYRPLCTLNRAVAYHNYISNLKINFSPMSQSQQLQQQWLSSSSTHIF